MVNWTALSSIFRGYLHSNTMNWYIYGTTVGFINSSAMQNEEHRKQATKISGSHVLLIPQEDITKPSSRFTQKLLPFCCSLPGAKYAFLCSLPFATLCLQAGVTASFLTTHKCFWGYTCSSWITVAQLCLEEIITKIASIPSFLLGFSSSFLPWIFGHMKTWQPAWRQLQVHVW